MSKELGPVVVIVAPRCFVEIKRGMTVPGAKRADGQHVGQWQDPSIINATRRILALRRGAMHTKLSRIPALIDRIKLSCRLTPV